MKIKKFDYLEFKICEFKKGKPQKTFPKEEIKIYLGLDPFDERIENFLITQEFYKNKTLIYTNPEDKKDTFEITLLKYNKTPERFVNLIIEMKFLNTQIEARDQQIAELKSELEKETTEYKKMSDDFKIKLEDMQKKAQDAINNHVQRNDEHMEAQITEGKKFALQKFLERIIVPLDNFEDALKYASKSKDDAVANYAKGFEMLFNQIDNILEDTGIFKIKPKIGDIFDPHIHQIYEIVEKKNATPDAITEVKLKGYKLHDRTLKPALVVVARSKGYKPVKSSEEHAEETINSVVEENIDLPSPDEAN